MSEANRAMNKSRERPASTISGYLMLLVLLAVAVIGIWLAASGAPVAGAGKGATLIFVGQLLASLGVFILIAVGFYMIQPNQATVITLFGEYRGTDRTEGLRWIWPWMGKKKLSARAHNIHSERVKINDKRGNPI
ncbi:MAG TPA: hypothetical protein VJZ74_06335, partial [Pseudolabrys sp.]|nr:hypothetical protein [Pseudolabrys sp.]